MTHNVTELVTGMLAGDRKSLARLITLVENGDSALPEIMEMLQPRPGRARRLGITGPPGSGKSTLIDKLVTKLRDSGLSVGVITVDPVAPSAVVPCWAIESGCSGITWIQGYLFGVWRAGAATVA